ncbi:MAG: hypothetical protein KBA46_01305 [Candidatus Omnitrophica bacterium]|nr:hypothetical protein [Candidatus Omnitrophota bacterium]
MRNIIKKGFETIGRLLTEDIKNRLNQVKTEINFTRTILIEDYLKNNLFNNPKYANDKKLSKYEFQVYSQHGEDGIIQEIFRRIGTTNQFFVEFGVEKGLECNSLFLIAKGWSGCWLDSGKGYVKEMHKKFKFLISEKRLAIKHGFITAENIEQLLSSLSIPREFDLLSIDIDGNDYWVWRAIQTYSPRVVVIEYNSIFRPPLEYIVKYDAKKVFPITSYFGASLKSMELLGFEKGYSLVGCNFDGTNAFFIRQDLVRDRFFGPFIAENHYEPPRYYLYTKIGHKTDFGAFVNKP